MPKPDLVSMAAAVSRNVVAGLYRLVKGKPTDDPAAGAGTPESDAAAARAERNDPESDGQPPTESEQTTITQTGRVVNQISGTVHGKVLQTGDIHGGVTF